MMTYQSFAVSNLNCMYTHVFNETRSDFEMPILAPCKSMTISQIILPLQCCLLALTNQLQYAGVISKSERVSLKTCVYMQFRLLTA